MLSLHDRHYFIETFVLDNIEALYQWLLQCPVFLRSPSAGRRTLRRHQVYYEAQGFSLVELGSWHFEASIGGLLRKNRVSTRINVSPKFCCTGI